MPSDSSHRNSGITVIAGTVLPGSHKSKSVLSSERMMSSPPMSPSHAMPRGTRRELYIR